MPSRKHLHRRTGSRREADWRSDRLPWVGGRDLDKLTVLAAIDKLVEAGTAEWRRLPEGNTEIRLSTGQRYRLAESGIFRTG